MSEDDPAAGDRTLDEPDDPTDGEFVEMPADGLDEEAVFEELVGEEETATGTERRRTAVVPKRSCCERCEFFADPPEVRCTNPGTEIEELVDTEHFRVVDCPVVERRRDVDGLDDGVEPGDR